MRTSGGGRVTRPDSVPTVVCGGSGSARTELVRLITERSDLGPVESVSSVEDAFEANADRVGVVICLGDPERGSGSVAPTVDRAAEGVAECPVVATGSNVDAAAAYEAGATDVVSLDATAHPETFVDQITAIVDRHVAGAFEMAMIDETDHGIVVHDPETAEVVACNERFYDLLGYDSSTYDITLSDFVGHDEAFSRERAVSLVRDAAAGESVAIEWRDPTNEGTDIWVEVRLEVTEFLSESYVVGSITNITERKRRERDHEWSRETFRGLHEITADPDAAFGDQVADLIQFATDRLGVDAGYLGRVDAESNSYEIEVAHGDDHLVREGATVPFDETYCQFVVEDPGRSMVAEAAVDESDYIDESVAGAGAPACYLGSEIYVDGEVYGTVCFVEETPRATSFTDEEQTFVRHVVEWLRREFEQTQYRQEIGQTRDRLEHTFERVSDAFFSLNLDWTVAYVNDAGEAVLREAMGLSEDTDPVGRHLWEEVPEAEGTRFESAYRGAMREQEQVTFVEHFEPMGKWFEVRVYPDEEGLSVYFTDVTDRQRTNAARRRLVTATEDLLNAETRDGLATSIVEAAADIANGRPTALYLADGGGPDTPVTPVAWAGAADEPPLPGDHEALETIHRDGATAIRAHNGTSGPDAVLITPVGDRGILVIGSDDPAWFDNGVRDRLDLLTANAASALSKVDRRRDLERFETVFETVQDMIYVIDEDGVIELVSEPLASAVGYDREELVGMHITEVTTDETAEMAESRVLDLLVTPDAVGDTFEGTLQHRDGTELPVEVELALLPYDDSFRGTVGSVRDISERRQREEELAVIQEAVTESGVGLALYNATGDFEYVNEQWAHMLGRSRDSVAETPVWETVEAISEASFEGHWARYEDGETRTQETQLRRVDHSTWPVELVVTRVTIDGEAHNVVTAYSIGDRRERRQQSEVLHRVLRHNLRNDLTVIRGHADLLAEQLDEDLARTAETIHRRASHLDQLADTAQQVQTVIGEETVRKPIDVTGLLRDAVEDVVAGRDVRVQADLPEKQEVLASPRLTLAFEQILDNAIEHGGDPPVSVSITVETDPDRRGWTAVEITDDGPGIPDEEVAVLNAGEETSLHHGSGLGLWVAHWVVTRYGGELNFDTGEDGGTVARIRLPSSSATTDTVADATERRRDVGR